MIQVLLLSSIFFTITLIGFVVILANIKTFVKKRDDVYRNDFSELKNELAEIKSMFRNEVSDVFKQIKKII